ncbi:4Fe-4S ferredoxin [Leminorella grimontii]|uniref:4Fe-4S ferredoxin n=1 Tax=Leminorella grimontii TaxID=82981 RepID=A0AAV5N954_9GAMM|nr:4Fe-4S dicluster domain-containing protein [Leminorella grimontii]KFC92793.1 HydN family electron transport protein [Leminorella grimontii ATCC 33999 = DSM 5078]GKX57569.1 4Fe-4S ferredoxin [Leminorella grimontii]GKX61314.1 4Fe-4S ferredoxin [Leminorella grimontii]VFS62437.1 Electron transport protein hydN [Leminorella grimontii]
MNRFVIADPKNCIGCRTCEVACAVVHSAGNDVANLSAKSFSPRIRVIRGSTVSTAILCRHCEDAPCAEVCPNGAIVRSNSSIQVIQEKCIGCKTCAIACPYGAMSIVTSQVTVPSDGAIVGSRLKAQALKCDLCEGVAESPTCIKVCPTNALRLVTPESLDALMRQKQERAALEEAGEIHF